MKTPLLIVSIIALNSLWSLPVNAGAQPNMHEALDDLRRGLASHTVDDLEAANLRLSHAKQNKGGYRVDAIAAIEKAIVLRKAGNHVEANRLISQAISLLEKGVAAGH